MMETFLCLFAKYVIQEKATVLKKMSTKNRRIELVDLLLKVEKKPKIVAMVTGGGSGFFQSLLGNGGASSVFLEGAIPYAKKAFDEYYGSEPDGYCSERAARVLAKKAYLRALHLGGGAMSMGVASTASLVSEGEREGRKHRFYVCIYTGYHQAVWGVEITSGNEYRDMQEEKVADFILERVVDAAYGQFNNVEWNSDCLSLTHDEINNCVHKQARIMPTYIPINHHLDPTQVQSPVVFPGSYNPIHPGHENMIQWAFEHLGRPVWLEISTDNVDKPSLDRIDIAERVQSIRGSNAPIAGIVITQSPKFVEKTYLFNQPTFLTGVDTYERLINVSYYEDEVDMREKHQEMKRYGAKFYVFHRDGFEANPDVLNQPPSALHDCTNWVSFEFSPTSWSSTALREASK